ncbi:MAG TPA: hypothetical protein DCP28_08300 [Cytophagales bacterium]|nr:hypothetical protein [Cytophagales bacterium]
MKGSDHIKRDSYSKEQALAEFSSLLEAAKEPMLLIEGETIVQVNKAGLVLLEVNPTDIKDTEIWTWLPKYQREGQATRRSIQRRFERSAQGQPQQMSWQWSTNTGKLLTTEVKVQAMPWKNADYLMLTVFEKAQAPTARDYDLGALTSSANLPENAPVLLKMTDPNNRFYHFSKQWLGFTGRKQKEELDDGWLENLHPEDKPIIKTRLEEAFSGRKKYEHTYRLKRHDGQYRYVVDTGIPCYDVEGNFTGFTAAAIYITDGKREDEQRNLDAALVESEKKLQQSLENVNFLAISTDNEGNITFCNQALLQASGFEYNDLLHKNIFDVLMPEGGKKIVRQRFKDFIRQGQLSGGFEAFMKTNQGGLLRVKFSTIILNNAQEQVSGMTIIGENITEKKKVREALNRTTTQLKQLFDNANDLIMAFNPDRSLTLVNQAWQEKLEYTEAENRKLRLDQIVEPSYKDMFLRYIERISKGERIEKIETVFLSKTGKQIHLSGSVNCSFEDGMPSEFRGIFHDITDRIRAEKAQNLYYKIANLTVQSDDLQNLFHNIHMELRKIIPVDNFYISLMEDETIRFPYFVDVNYGDTYIQQERRLGKGLTEYAMYQSKPTFMVEDDIVKLAVQEKIVLHGPLAKVWLGVPMRLDNRVTGLICVQDYNDPNTYSLKDLELLDFISGQIALAIERKRNEEKIMTQTARLNAIFESSSHLIWSVNRKGEHTSYNTNYSDFLDNQYRIEPISPTQAHDGLEIVNQQYEEFWGEKFDKVFSGESLNFEMGLSSGNGEEHFKEFYLNPIFQNGKITEVSGIGHDITEEKLYQLRLKEREETFRNIFESIQDIYFQCDPNGTITMLSPSILELTGYDPDETLNKNITDYYLYNKKTKDLIRQLIRKRRVRNFEATIIRKDGQLMQCICNVRLILNRQHGTISIEGVARDITQLKKVNEDLVKAKEVAEKSLKVKEQFLANMSHEIRTPMNGIIGMIDLLDNTTLDQEQQRFVGTIKKSSETLLNILNDILDLSKIEAGKMKLKKTGCRLSKTIEKLHALFEQNAVNKDITLKYHLMGDLPEFVNIDETRFLQVCSNLLSNAIKFTESSGTVDISLQVKEKRSENKYLIEAKVKDSGIGISQEDMKKLFGTFNQLDTSSTKSYGGTGLGLAISKQLCRLMGGDIGVWSAPGLGSTFWFTAIMEEVDEEVVLDKERAERALNLEGYRFPDDAQPKILLTDDNAINRMVAGEILNKANCDTHFASSGKEAIEKIQQDTFDLLFMDIQMPEMDGVETTRNLRSLDNITLPPIVAMTAYSMKEDRERFLEAGMDDYLPKPIKANMLIRKVIEYARPEDLNITPEEIDAKIAALKAEEPTPEPVIAEPPSVRKEADSEPIVDAEVIGQLGKYGGNELIKMTLDEFALEAEEFLGDMEQALTTQDYQDILGKLHTLKGNAGTLGVQRVATAAKETEAKLKASPQAGYPELSRDLKWLREKHHEFKNNYLSFLNL